MKNNLNLEGRRAVRIAKKVIEQLCIRKPSELLIEEVAWTHGLKVVDGRIDGSLARLLRVGDKGIIRVSDKLGGGMRRFAIAHELGHFKLHEGAGEIAICSDRDIAIWHRNCNHEHEANTFASELLMPEALFANKCDVSKVSFDVVTPLAEEFHTSLTATVLRFVKFCPEPCAVIVSEDGKIKWHRKSEYFPYWITNGASLDKYSLAYEYFDGKKIPENIEEVSASSWTDSSHSSKEIWEHSFAMPNYNSVLTLLWAPVD